MGIGVRFPALASVLTSCIAEMHEAKKLNDDALVEIEESASLLRELSKHPDLSVRDLLKVARWLLFLAENRPAALVAALAQMSRDLGE